jgi:hypothetical protein
VEVLVVLHEHRSGVAFAKSGLPEQVRQLVGPRLHLAEGHDRAGGQRITAGLSGVASACSRICMRELYDSPD